MSIKTSELQQLQTILGADSLLADTAAAGTGRFSAAKLAQFMDAELLKPGTALSAALSNKAALSTQNTVEATSVPTRTVEVAAADLPAYIAGLPKLLTEKLTVKVTGTATVDYLTIEGLYGSGFLTVIAKADGDTVLKASVRVSACAVPVCFKDIRFQDHNPGGEGNRFGLLVDTGSTVIANGCSFTTTDGGTEYNHGYIALKVANGSYVCTTGIKNASGCACVAQASNSGVIVCSAATVGALHDNSFGASVWEGGIVYICGASPDTLGGAANVKNTGLIVKGGALL